MSDDTRERPKLSEALNFDEFDVPSYDEWRQAAQSALKGASFEKQLVTQTDENISIQPIYVGKVSEADQLDESLPGIPPYKRGIYDVRNGTKPWNICQVYRCKDVSTFNQTIKRDLTKGLTEIQLVLDTECATGMQGWNRGEDFEDSGLYLLDMTDMANALDGVPLDQIPLFIDCQSGAMGIGATLIAHCFNSNVSPSSLKGCVGMSPIGQLARMGAVSTSMSAQYNEMFIFTRWMSQNAPAVKTVLAQGHAYHNGGATAVQELAFGLAEAISYIRALMDRGMCIDDAARQVVLGTSIGGHFFMEIAKLRAARMLYADLIRTMGGGADAQKLYIYARTSRRNQTLHDHSVNILRTGTETFSAAIGGANSIHAGPFDEFCKETNFFSQRIARNTQILLREESKVGQVADPLGGSWYVETLTDDLAREVWGLFQEIEAQGGIVPALIKGYPQALLKDTAAKKKKQLDQCKDVLIGTNIYPDLQEPPMEVDATDYRAIDRQAEERKKERLGKQISSGLKIKLDRLADLAKTAMDTEIFDGAIECITKGATVFQINNVLRKTTSRSPFRVAPIHMERAGAHFEALRSDAERLFNADQFNASQVYLLTMQNDDSLRTRLDYTQAFFAIGGFGVIEGSPWNNPKQAVDAAVQSNAPIVVLCGSDESYPALIPQVVPLLKQCSSDVLVLLAGNPRDNAKSFRELGIDEFIYRGVDTWNILHNLLGKLGHTDE